SSISGYPHETSKNRFTSDVAVVETKISLKGGRSYYEVGANTIGSMIYPPLFDHYFSRDIQQYNSSTSFLSSWVPFLSLSRTRRFYHRMKESPFWSALFEAYSQAGDGDKKFKIEQIRNKAQSQSGGYIGQPFSEDAAKGVFHLMSRASPHTTRFVWWASYLVLFVAEILFGFVLFSSISAETFRQPSPGHPFWWVDGSWSKIFYGLMLFYIFSIGCLSPIASLLNILVTRIRQFGVHKMHRPKVLNRKHVRVIALLTFGFYVLSAVLYSYGAGHGYGRFVGHLSNTLGIPKIAHALGRFAATVALPFAIKEIGLLGSVTRPLAEKLLGHAIRGTNLSLGLLKSC
ncbi:hypothetical protein, partial [Acidithiobacillus caldus]|uniref:hypothetical protein n=1 Tax=Acidithiobacillus caldus TaxID=33059 RepID=UPI001C074526